MICYVVSFLLWIFVLRKNNLSYIVLVTYGILSILSLAVSFFILRETIYLKTVLESLIIIAGILIMNLK